MAATGYLLSVDEADVERNLPPEVPFDPNDRAVSTAGAAVSITVTADPDRPIVISQVICGYDATPTGGLLTIEDVSGTVVFRVPIAAAGVQQFDFVPNKCSAVKNSALIITLAAAGGSILGYLNVNVRKHR